MSLCLVGCGPTKTIDGKQTDFTITYDFGVYDVYIKSEDRHLLIPIQYAKIIIGDEEKIVIEGKWIYFYINPYK